MSFLHMYALFKKLCLVLVIFFCDISDVLPMLIFYDYLQVVSLFSMLRVINLTTFQNSFKHELNESLVSGHNFFFFSLICLFCFLLLLLFLFSPLCYNVGFLSLGWVNLWVRLQLWKDWGKFWWWEGKPSCLKGGRKPTLLPFPTWRGSAVNFCLPPSAPKDPPQESTSLTLTTNHPPKFILHSSTDNPL